MKISILNLILCTTAIIGCVTAIISIAQNHTQKIEAESFQKLIKSLVAQDSEISIVVSKKEPNSTNNPTQETKWTVQVAHFTDIKGSLEWAVDLAKILKEVTGLNTFIARRDDEIVFCVGRFSTQDDDGIKEILSRVVKMEYNGKLQFADSYPIQIR